MGETRGPWLRWLVGVAAASLVVAACGGTGPVQPSTGPGSFAVGSEAPAASPTTLPTSVAPPSAVPATEAPATPGASVEGTTGPSGSVAQYLVSISIRHTASCTSDNGTGTIGNIRVSWVAEGTTGVRISIDPPSPDVAYGYGYADYLELAGSADVPFACSPSLHDAKGSYHLYVVTTLHAKYGHYFYRYAKVYDSTP